MIGIVGFLLGIAANLCSPMYLAPWMALLLLFVSGLGLLWFSIRGARTEFKSVFDARYWRGGLMLVAGFAWCQWFAQHQLSLRLPPLLEGQDVVVYGQVVSVQEHLPAPTAHAGSPSSSTLSSSATSLKSFQGQQRQLHQTLVIDADCVVLLAQATEFAPEDCHYRGARIRLRIYERLPVATSQQWRISARLKSPRGFANPGGFDYERYLFANGIHATGYHKAWPKAQALQQADSFSLLDLHRLRSDVELIAAMGQSDAGGLARALLLGERQAVSEAVRELMQKTGTAHLLAISGLHIAVAGSFGYYTIFSLCYLFPALTSIAPRKMIALLGALPIAVFYAALSGFALTTQRALLMMLVVVLVALSGRRIHRFRYWCIALIALLLLNPLLVFRTGFWFSFVAVAILLWTHSAQALSWWRRLWLAQWALFIGMAPLYAAVDGQPALLAPVANMLIIPVISFTVIPLGLLAVMLWPLVPSVAIPLLLACEQLLQWCLQRLNSLVVLIPADAVLPNFSFSITASALSAVLFCIVVLATSLVILPGRYPGKWVALCVVSWLWLGQLMPQHWSPWLRPQPVLEAGEFRVTQLDVGQGTAVLIETARHHLLYDTGARFSDRFTVSEAVILPYLDSIGVETIDLVVVSHADSDHAGGVDVLRDSGRVLRWLLGEPLPLLADEDVAACHAGQAWEWDGVEFAVLYPKLDHHREGNDSSCVLRIVAGQHAVLLTGDISVKAEAELLSIADENISSAIVTAAHHGSATSSSEAFVDATKPHWVLVSAGYRNRYGHPAPSVLRRYREAGAEVLTSAKLGAIQFHVTAQRREIQGPYCARYRSRRLWQNVDNTAQCAQSL